MAGINLMWIGGVIGGWYITQYVYNHFLADTVNSFDASLSTDPMLLTDPNAQFPYMGRRYR